MDVVDLAGKTKTLSRGWRWGSEHAVAWSPDGSEVWFSATEAGWVNPIRAVSLSGKQRLVLRLPAWLTVLDISQDGRALVTITTHRSRMFGLAPGESKERELSWYEGSFVRDITPDGKTLLFDEAGEGSSAANTLCARDGWLSGQAYRRGWSAFDLSGRALGRRGTGEADLPACANADGSRGVESHRWRGQGLRLGLLVSRRKANAG